MKQKIFIDGVAEIRITETGTKVVFAIPAEVEGTKVKTVAEVIKNEDSELLLVFSVPAGEYAQGYSTISVPVTDREAQRNLGIMLEFAEKVNELVDQVAARVSADVKGKTVNVENAEKFTYALKKALRNNWQAIADTVAGNILAKHLGLKEVISLSPIVGEFDSSRFLEGFKETKGKEAEELVAFLMEAKNSFINYMKRYEEILDTPVGDVHAINYYDPAYLLARRGCSTLLRLLRVGRKSDISFQKNPLVDKIYNEVVDIMKNTFMKKTTVDVEHDGIHGEMEVCVASDKRSGETELYTVGVVTGSVDQICKSKTLREFCNYVVRLIACKQEITT